MDVFRQSACLALNPITVYSYGFLFNRTTVGQASYSMTALAQSFNRWVDALVRIGFPVKEVHRSFLGLPILYVFTSILIRVKAAYSVTMNIFRNFLFSFLIICKSRNKLCFHNKNVQYS